MKIQLLKVVRAILPMFIPDGFSNDILLAGVSHAIQLEVGVNQENVWFKEIKQGKNRPKARY